MFSGLSNTAIACPPTQLIPHSKSLSLPVASGDTVEVMCDTGYHGVGDMSAMCSDDQSWIQPSGSCKRK